MDKVTRPETDSQKPPYPVQNAVHNRTQLSHDPLPTYASGDAKNININKQKNSKQSRSASTSHVIHPIPMDIRSDTDWYTSDSSMDVDYHVTSASTKQKKKNNSGRTRTDTQPLISSVDDAMDTSENFHSSEAESIICNKEV